MKVVEFNNQIFVLCNQGMEQDRKQSVKIDLGLYEWMKWSGGKISVLVQ